MMDCGRISRFHASSLEEELQGVTRSLQENGFVIIDEFLSQDQVCALKQQAKSIVDATDLSKVDCFSTSNSQPNVRYFLESGPAVFAFTEEKDRRRINKIGHDQAMHDIDPIFQQISYSEKVRWFVHNVHLINRAFLIQSMYIFKSKSVGGEVPPHQDSTYLFTDPLSTKAMWFALDDADQLNGCLYAVPGSHQWPLKSRSRVAEENMMVVDTLDHSDWDLSSWSLIEQQKRAVPLQVKSGTMIAFDGSLVHFSAANQSDKDREAYTIHFIDSDSNYPADNWLQRPHDFPFRLISR